MAYREVTSRFSSKPFVLRLLSLPKPRSDNAVEVSNVLNASVEQSGVFSVNFGFYTGFWWVMWKNG